MRTATRASARSSAPPDPDAGLEQAARAWAATTQPRHWNYWRREVEAYRSEQLAASLRDTGLEMPGSVVLLDWAFMGDGAIGEDLGNHIPDAVFDLFWPADRLAELDAACFDGYLSGLRAAGWRGNERDVRLGVVASCVKYAWLLPRMLEAAAGIEHRAYHQAADPRVLYQQRGLALQYLVGWCDEALRLRLGDGR